MHNWFRGWMLLVFCLSWLHFGVMLLLLLHGVLNIALFQLRFIVIYC